MKTIRIITMLFVLVSFTNITMAAGTQSLLVDINPLQGKRAIIAVTNNTTNNYEIVIEDSDGNEVLNDESKGVEKNYKKVYNLSKLDEGNYKMVVKSDGVISEHDINIANNSVNIGKASVNVDPLFTQNGEILRLAYLNANADNVKLTIYDGDYMIYKESLGSSFAVNKGLSLAKLEPGTYRVILTAGSQKYGYDAEVK